jgi:GH15 family glucan-1,4-alpha-glucosidase
VRIGNAASGQLQLDIFGEFLSAIYLARKGGLPARTDSFPAARVLLQYLGEIWQQPDDGIWEVRGGRRHFTYSKIMSWVAVDRAVRLIQEFHDGGDAGAKLLPKLCALRARIHEEVCSRGFHPGVGAFTQSYGASALDASVLLIPHVQFLSAYDPRVQSTVAAIERTLLRDGFVLRYQTEEGVDGLPGTEGAFLACSFWLADNYAFAGRMDEAEELFEQLLALRTPLGLLAEEYDPSLRRLVGNFPQGFSHLALITSANVLDAATRGEPVRSDSPPDEAEPMMH